MDLEEYYTVSEAKVLLKCSRQEVVRKIWRGTITAIKKGKAYLIHYSEINKLKR